MNFGTYVDEYQDDIVSYIEASVASEYTPTDALLDCTQMDDCYAMNDFIEIYQDLMVESWIP